MIKIFTKSVIFWLVVVILATSFANIKVLAADYQSKWVGQSNYLTLTAGQTETVWVEFQNTGSANWNRDGANAVHLGTAKQLDRKSMFYQDSSWLSMNRIRMQQEVVKPGEVARFEFQIEAPVQAGVYQEHFRPVAENVTWLNDQGVYWEWRVNSGAGYEEMCVSKDSKIQAASSCTMPEAWMYDSQWDSQSDYVQMKVGEVKDVSVEFVNNGVATWTQSGDFAVHLGTANPIDRKSVFYHNSWISNNRIMMVQSKVKAGEKAKFNFKIQAPTVAGTYYEYFRPVAENVSWLKDEGVFWRIEVMADEVTPPDDNNPPPSDDSDYTGKTGVPISVGAAKVSSDGSFEVFNAYTNKMIKSVNAGTQVALKYESGRYKIWVGDVYYESPDYVQLRAKNGAILRVDSYNDVKSWNTSLNDNLFRDTVEIRYSDITNQTWIINELPMEDYVAGIAESGESSPTEYLKAMSIAARTYVQYHKNLGGRHAENFIDLYNSVNGNGDDQVYRGYGFELRNPSVVSAAKSTIGKMVTYGGKVVVTPYFSQSDGRTRSSEEVWGTKSYPWCKSVADPYNVGKELRGHGVGLSASGALNFASEEGKSYDWILKYYYTGIDISTVDTSSTRVRVGIYKL